MFGDRKKAVTAILGSPSDEKDVEKNEMQSALHSVAEELIDAVHSKDPHAVVAALRAAHAECSNEGEEE